MADPVGYCHRIWLLILFLLTTQYAAAQQADTELTADAFNISTEVCRIYGSTSESKAP